MNEIKRLAKKLKCTKSHAKQLYDFQQGELHRLDLRGLDKPESWRTQGGRAVNTDRTEAWLGERKDDLFFVYPHGEVTRFSFDPDEIDQRDCPPGVSLNDSGLFLAYKPLPGSDDCPIGRVFGFLANKIIAFCISRDGSIEWADYCLKNGAMRLKPRERDQVLFVAASFFRMAHEAAVAGCKDENYLDLQFEDLFTAPAEFDSVNE